MKKVKWCSRILFTSPLYYGLCLGEASFKKEMKRMDITDYPKYISTGCDATTHFLVNDKEEQLALVVMEESVQEDPEQVRALLVHEAMHIWREIKDSIGELAPSLEFEAHAMQHITQELFYKYKELTDEK